MIIPIVYLRLTFISTTQSDDRTREWVDSIRRSRAHSLDRSSRESPYHGQNEPLPDQPTIASQHPPPPRRDLPPTPGSGLNILPTDPAPSRRSEREYEHSIATRARSPSVRSQRERATSPVPAWLHRRPNTTSQVSRAMSPLPPLPGVVHH